jgi:hypothetical protein
MDPASSSLAAVAVCYSFMSESCVVLAKLNDTDVSKTGLLHVKMKKIDQVYF